MKISYSLVILFIKYQYWILITLPYLRPILSVEPKPVIYLLAVARNILIRDRKCFLRINELNYMMRAWEDYRSSK
jgi:hypothetical protein